MDAPISLPCTSSGIKNDQADQRGQGKADAQNKHNTEDDHLCPAEWQPVEYAGRGFKARHV
jgi:hypothetical protein